MKTVPTLLNLYTSLTQNTSASNQSLGLQLMNDEHRYTLQKYFDNEREYQTTTVGSMTLASTATIALNAVSATLTASWAYPTVNQLVTFSDGEQRSVLFTNGSTAITWVGGLTSACTTVLTTAGVQDYAVPSTISKITSTYIQIGQLRFVPVPILTRVDWDRVNFLPYSSDIVNYVYLYGGKIKFWPIPSTTGEIIQFNYKARVADFSFIFGPSNVSPWVPGTIPQDYSAGTITPPAVGGTNVVGSSTAWNSTAGFPLNVDVTYFNLYLKINPPSGDGFWYPISQFNSDTSLTLATPIQNQPTTVGGATYSIGQMPVLDEDFHDMIIHGRPLQTYFSSIVDDPNKFKQFSSLYEQSTTRMEDWSGTKFTNVDLEAEPVLANVNNYPFAQP